MTSFLKYPFKWRGLRLYASRTSILFWTLSIWNRDTPTPPLRPPTDAHSWLKRKAIEPHGVNEGGNEGVVLKAVIMTGSSLFSVCFNMFVPWIERPRRKGGGGGSSHPTPPPATPFTSKDCHECFMKFDENERKEAGRLVDKVKAPGTPPPLLESFSRPSLPRVPLLKAPEQLWTSAELPRKYVICHPWMFALAIFTFYFFFF